MGAEVMAKKIQANPQGQSSVSEQFIAPLRGGLEQDIDLLKWRLLLPMLRHVQNPRLRNDLEWAANEATAQAWLTPFPFLVLPALLEENLATARRKYVLQQRILRRSLPLVLPAQEA
jgi:hypothetical protein